jgi:UDP-glucose:(glucosyl)LPS alpha-1,2-glucosyltransferase
VNRASPGSHPHPADRLDREVLPDDFGCDLLVTGWQDSRAHGISGWSDIRPLKRRSVTAATRRHHAANHAECLPPCQKSLSSYHRARASGAAGPARSVCWCDVWCKHPGRQDGAVFPGIDFRPVSPTLWRLGNTNVRYAAAVASALKDLKPALVEVHNRPEIALTIAAGLPSIPVTVTLHNDPQGMRDAATPVERTSMLRRLARVITSSDYLRQRLLDGIEPPARNPVVLPNCLDLTELPPPRKRERLILFAGRVVADKGPDAFVSACAAALPHLPGWGAEIIGADRFNVDSPDTGFVQMIRAAAEGANVRMLGYRDHPEVLAAMARAAIVVVPSRWPEPFGLVALEALASGAALICAPRGGLREVAGDAAVYADPDRPGEIATAIRALAGDESRRAALTEAGWQRARLFDVPVIAARLAALRADILAAGG